MKKMIAVLALFGASALNAQELNFGDINYFLKQGEFNLAADANFTYDRQTSGNDVPLETRGMLFETRYGFGVLDNLNFYLGVDYAFDREVEDTTAPPAPSDADFKQDGFANPMLSANYRLLNQRDSMVNLDFGLEGRFNLQDAETGYSDGQESKDGNFADGRNSFQLNSRVGNKWNEANEWQLAGGIVYHTSGERTELSENKTVDIESSADFFLKATYQYLPVDELLMSISVQATQIGKVDSDMNGVESNTDSYTDFDFTFRAKYLITKRLIASFQYGMSRNADYDVKGDVAYEVKRRRENYYGLGVDLLF